MIKSTNAKLRCVIWVWLASCGVGILFYSYLHFSETAAFPAVIANVKGFAASMFVSSAVGIALYFVNLYLDRFIRWGTHFVWRFILGYLIDVIVGMAICLSLAWVLISTFGSAIFWQGLSIDDEDLTIKIGILFLTSLFIYTVIYSLLYSYKQYAVAQIDSLQKERKQLELQFEALKSQISPHYLFNSLNTISSLILKDPQSAEQFVRRLAQTYQYILSSQHKQYVLLREEVEFVQSYYYLLRIRFQQMLNIEINLPSNIMDTRMPPLTLQLLVENAVKHNNITADKPLFIYISAVDNTHIRIINTKADTDFSVNSFKVGLENIRKRYEYFTDKKIEIRDEEKFTVSLPVLALRTAQAHQKHSA